MKQKYDNSEEVELLKILLRKVARFIFNFKTFSATKVVFQHSDLGGAWGRILV